jgi:DNA end-binding protein Ku
VPRPIWHGSIRFGLVTIPVGLYSAESRDEIDLDLLDRRNMARVGYSKVNKETGEEVPSAEIVKGYEIEKGRYVVVEKEDIAGASPEATQSVDIVEFVDSSAIDPIYYDRPYYLAPLKQGEKPYALLREALRRSGRVGIARLVVRTRQYVAAVYPWERALVVHLLRYQHELREPAQLDLPPAGSTKSGLASKELQMAERLISEMVEEWKPTEFKDEYRGKLLALIRKKAKAGEEWQVPEVGREAPPAKVVDLMSLLKRSVEQQSSGPATSRRGTRASRRATGSGRSAKRTGRRSA